MRNRAVMYASDQNDAIMASVEGSNILADGLRMLCGLAQHSPLELPEFAEMNALCLSDAARFMTAFEHCGYVCQLPFSDRYILTPQAVSILGNACQPSAAAPLTMQ